MDTTIAENSGEIKAHFNPAFEKTEGILVPISEGILDSRKHSAVTFKENAHSNNLGSSATYIRARKNMGDRSSVLTTLAVKGRGSWFKTSGNSQSQIMEPKEKRADSSSIQEAFTVENVSSEAAVQIVDDDTDSRQ